MTEHNYDDDINQLSDLMSTLKIHSTQLKDHLLSGVIIRHKAYTIQRERDIFSPVRYESELNTVNSLFQIISGNPLNTKEAELFPGFIQVNSDSFEKTFALTKAINDCRKNLKSFLTSRKKNTCITTDSGVSYTQNPLMFRHYPMVNTMQMYRQLTCVNTDTSKGSFLWQSNKRYLKYDMSKTMNILNSALLSPAPLHIDGALWKKHIEVAIDKIERLPPDIVITKICSTEPKPHFKFKPNEQKLWTSHYGATPLIISNKDDHLFNLDKKMRNIEVTNKHRNLPVGPQWTPFCESLSLYYQR